ncbi:MAG: flavin reductase family protein [Pseudomonadota bacterium]
MNMHARQEQFDPAVIDTRILRNAFSRYATGVTVVTAMTPDGPMGMTVNSFTSVSLEPPLTLWSIERKSTRYDAFAGAWDTAIHVLSREQEALCLGFAKHANAFDLVEWAPGANGTPLMEGCLARFTCRRHGTHEAGDHTILVDQILSADITEGAPLVFNQGTFGGFLKD